MSPRASVASATLLAAIAAALAPACSQGEGTGAVCGTLNVPDCWVGSFNLHPDFFAAIPTPSTDSLQIRIQSGGDYESFSDGIALLVDDAGEIRGDPTDMGTPRPSLLGQTLVVGLSPEVTPEGIPVVAVASPTIVHATLYLDKTCRTENDALYALSAVTLGADGTCEGAEAPLDACGPPETITADGGVDVGTSMADASAGGTDASAGAFDATANGSSPGGGSATGNSPAMMSSATASSSTTCDTEDVGDDGGGSLVTSPGTSTIVFNSLFDGNEAETNAQQRLTDAQFDLYFADPRDICPNGSGPPPPCRAHLSGYMRFYFQRGQPAQPFP